MSQESVNNESRPAISNALDEKTIRHKFEHLTAQLLTELSPTVKRTKQRAREAGGIGGYRKTSKAGPGAKDEAPNGDVGDADSTSAVDAPPNVSARAWAEHLANVESKVNTVVGESVELPEDLTKLDAMHTSKLLRGTVRDEDRDKFTLNEVVQASYHMTKSAQQKLAIVDVAKQRAIGSRLLLESMEKPTHSTLREHVSGALQFQTSLNEVKVSLTDIKEKQKQFVELGRNRYAKESEELKAAEQEAVTEKEETLTALEEQIKKENERQGVGYAKLEQLYATIMEQMEKWRVEARAISDDVLRAQRSLADCYEEKNMITERTQKITDTISECEPIRTKLLERLMQFDEECAVSHAAYTEQYPVAQEEAARTLAALKTRIWWMLDEALLDVWDAFSDVSACRDKLARRPDEQRHSDLEKSVLAFGNAVENLETELRHSYQQAKNGPMELLGWLAEEKVPEMRKKIEETCAGEELQRDRQRLLAVLESASNATYEEWPRPEPLIGPSASTGGANGKNSGSRANKSGGADDKKKSSSGGSGGSGSSFSGFLSRTFGRVMASPSKSDAEKNGTNTSTTSSANSSPTKSDVDAKV